MPRHVLFVDTPVWLGGAEISILALMTHLDASRYVPHLLTSGDGAFPDQARRSGIGVSTQDFPWFSRRRPWRYVLGVLHLAQLVRRHDIELVHTNCDHSLPYVMRASQLARVPYVSHVRDLVREWFRPDKLAALNRARLVIANSNAVAEACADRGVARDRIEVVYNPIDTDRFSQKHVASGEALRTDFDIPRDALAVGLVGQVEPLKGHEDLILAAPHVLSQVPNAHFVIAGGVFTSEMRAFQAHLRALVEETGIAESFHFLGFRDDVPAVMRALDILTVPSHTEAFGRVVVEGLAAGCALIASNVGGIPEIVTPGVDGLLVPPRDVESLSTAIIQLARDRDLRAKLRSAAPKTATRFNTRYHVAQIQALYDSVLR
jgi:glycosyltransferase involved in cell wall biosynthesis